MHCTRRWTGRLLSYGRPLAMVWIIVTVPLMLVGIGIALWPLIGTVVHERRRRPEAPALEAAVRRDLGRRDRAPDGHRGPSTPRRTA